MAAKRRRPALEPFARDPDGTSFPNGLFDDSDSTSSTQNDSTIQVDGGDRIGGVDGLGREWIEENHPVKCGEYGFATTQLTGAYDLIKDYVKFRRTGLAFVASSRHGKTTGIELIARQLQRDFPSLAVLWFIGESHNTPLERSFFGGLMSFFRVRDPFKGSGAILRDRTKCFFEMQGRRSKGRHIVLFIDEAQRLFVEEWEWLSDIMNYLKDRRIFLTVVSWGQPELLERRNLAVNTEQANLVYRFFSDMRTFSGIGNEDELGKFMGHYDEQKYPHPNGPSYTQFFLPKAWSAGFRLQNESRHLWTALTAAAPLGMSEGYALEHVVISIHSFLIDSADHDSPVFNQLKLPWDDHVSASGLVEAMSLLEISK